MRIMFVCHGNIYRSPMAELIMKSLARESDAEARYEIASSATSDEEIWGGVFLTAEVSYAILLGEF